ncbi:MAG: hypothetical protein ACYC39_03075 [Thiobacillus sp.]
MITYANSGELFVGFPILRHWYAVYPAGRQLSVVARAFLDYLLGRGKGKAAPAVRL